MGEVGLVEPGHDGRQRLAAAFSGITSVVDYNSDRSACKTCLGSTHCCIHARYSRMADARIDVLVCVCGGGCTKESLGLDA